MVLSDSAFVIALTGPFGSGCSTTAELLRSHLGFEILRLSEVVRSEWAVRNSGAAAAAQRHDLQELGNTLREEAGNAGELVRRALEPLDTDALNHERIVIDAVRSVGEIEHLRKRFGHNFFLFAMECEPSERWERVRQGYEALGQGLQDFVTDNQADRDQEWVFGQQVQLCVDRADVLIVNAGDVAMPQLRARVTDFAELVLGTKPRYPTALERFMNLAYSSALASKCLKRQVGAVVVEAAPGDDGDIVAVGYNENPRGTLPCVDEPTYGANATAGAIGRCYRDIVRQESFVEHARRGVLCPGCGTPLSQAVAAAPPWKCEKCSKDLEQYFWPERAMTLCTAVHAEL